jgi:hypothetical protein
LFFLWRAKRFSMPSFSITLRMCWSPKISEMAGVDGVLFF